eukprot:g147.t1
MRKKHSRLGPQYPISPSQLICRTARDVEASAAILTAAAIRAADNRDQNTSSAVYERTLSKQLRPRLPVHFAAGLGKPVSVQRAPRTAITSTVLSDLYIRTQRSNTADTLGGSNRSQRQQQQQRYLHRHPSSFLAASDSLYDSLPSLDSPEKRCEKKKFQEKSRRSFFPSTKMNQTSRRSTSVDIDAMLRDATRQQAGKGRRSEDGKFIIYSSSDEEGENHSRKDESMTIKVIQREEDKQVSNDTTTGNDVKVKKENDKMEGENDKVGGENRRRRGRRYRKRKSSIQEKQNSSRETKMNENHSSDDLFESDDYYSYSYSSDDDYVYLEDAWSGKMTKSDQSAPNKKHQNHSFIQCYSNEAKPHYVCSFFPSKYPTPSKPKKNKKKKNAKSSHSTNSKESSHSDCNASDLMKLQNDILFGKKNIKNKTKKKISGTIQPFMSAKLAGAWHSLRNCPLQQEKGKRSHKKNALKGLMRLRKCHFDKNLLAYHYSDDEDNDESNNIVGSRKNREHVANSNSNRTLGWEDDVSTPLSQWAPLRPHIHNNRKDFKHPKIGVEKRKSRLPAIWHHRGQTVPPLFRDDIRRETPIQRRAIKTAAKANLPKRHALRRVVYDYWDRYGTGTEKYIRLIPRQCLAFDSHFESANLLKAERVFQNTKRKETSTNTPKPFPFNSETAGKLFGIGMDNVMERLFRKPDGTILKGVKKLSATDWLGPFQDAEERENVSIPSAITEEECIPKLEKDKPKPPQEMQEYDLTLACDVSTDRHVQWFYFMVRNMKVGVQYRFYLHGFYKPDAHFNYGQRPVRYSHKAAVERGEGWTPCGYDISYVPAGDGSYRHKYVLCFTVEFEFEGDDEYCFFAFCPPYTYTDLRACLGDIMSDPRRAQFVKQRKLCTTLAGNSVDVLTITRPSKSYKQKKNDVKEKMKDKNENGNEEDETKDNKKKTKKNENVSEKANNASNCSPWPILPRSQRPVAVLTARVHPGEANASWIMEGLLHFLTDPDDPDARKLRNCIEFYVIPMLNPDGVINGNYRCNLSGDDLNRQYQDPSSTEHGPVFHLKRLLKSFHKENRNFEFYCDFHGHSRKNEVFMYGCVEKRTLGTRPVPLQKRSRSHSKIVLHSSSEKVKTWASPPGPHQAIESPGSLAMAARAQQKSEKLAKDRLAKQMQDERESLKWLDQAHAMVFPLLLAKETSMFSFAESRFTVHKSKAGTGRVVVYKECQVPAAYTLESSFCGFSLKNLAGGKCDGEKGQDESGKEISSGKSKMVHFMPCDWISMGAAFGRSLRKYWEWYKLAVPKLPTNNSFFEPVSPPIRALDKEGNRAKRDFESELVLRWQHLPIQQSSAEFESDSDGDGKGEAAVISNISARKANGSNSKGGKKKKKTRKSKQTKLQKDLKNAKIIADAAVAARSLENAEITETEDTNEHESDVEDDDEESKMKQTVEEEENESREDCTETKETTNNTDATDDVDTWESTGDDSEESKINRESDAKNLIGQPIRLDLINRLSWKPPIDRSCSVNLKDIGSRQYRNPSPIDHIRADIVEKNLALSHSRNTRKDEILSLSGKTSLIDPHMNSSTGDTTEAKKHTLTSTPIISNSSKLLSSFDVITKSISASADEMTKLNQLLRPDERNELVINQLKPPKAKKFEAMQRATIQKELEFLDANEDRDSNDLEEEINTMNDVDDNDEDDSNAKAIAQAKLFRFLQVSRGHRASNLSVATAKAAAASASRVVKKSISNTLERKPRLATEQTKIIPKRVRYNNGSKKRRGLKAVKATKTKRVNSNETNSGKKQTRNDVGKTILSLPSAIVGRKPTKNRKVVYKRSKKKKKKGKAK